MPDPDDIRARLLQLDTLTLFEDSLEAALLAKAAARLEKAEACAGEHDTRDVEAAGALVTLAEQIAAIRQKAALLHRRDALLEETKDAEDISALHEIENDTIDAIGFRLKYASAEDFLTNLVSDLEARADKAANED